MNYKLTTHSNGWPFLWQAQDGETYLAVTDETGKDLDIRLEGLPILDDDFGSKGYIGNINVQSGVQLPDIEQQDRHGGKAL